MTQNSTAKSTERPLSLALIRQRYTPYGGAERFVARAVEGLSRAGRTQVTVLARSWDAVDDESYDLQACNPFFYGRLWRDISFAASICRRVAKGGFDLVQSHERIPCCDIFRAGDGVHKEWILQRGREGGKLIRFLDFFSLYHRYVMHAERKLFASPTLKAVICNSEMVKKEIQTHFQVPEHKLHVIYSGVDTDKFSPASVAELRQKYRSEWKIPDEAMILLFVGSGYRRKGLAYVMRAMMALPLEVWLVVVGKDKRIKDFSDSTRWLNIENRVRFAGEREDVLPFYAVADAVVLPTLYDPFPNVALEAMACGLPLITSFKSGASDLIRHGENGYLCDPLESEQMVADITALLDPATRARIGAAGRETVLPFTTERMVQETIAVYNRVLEGR